jgi:histidine ammonia-lyase
LGPAADILKNVFETISIEINSTTDNPLFENKTGRVY